MNKLKNIGISALAGTLVSLSAAQAGGVSVSGNMELTYVNLNHEKVTGNKLGMNKNLTFGSSGDVTDGGGVTWTSTVVMGDTANLSSASMSLNMGGIATLAYDSGTGGYGANAVDNVVPTAFEEADAGFSTGMVLSGGAITPYGSIIYKLPEFSGAKIAVAYNPRGGSDAAADGATGGDVGGGGAAHEIGVDWSPEMVPGLRVGGAWGSYDRGGTSGKDLDEETY